MKLSNLILTVLAASMLAACGSQPAKTDDAEKTPAAKASSSKATPAKEESKKEEAKKEEAAAEGEIVGKPAAGSKFAKLKIGMTHEQVQKLIGMPAKEWHHPTGKASIPFYFGPDRWVLQSSYKKEGVLTFNYGGEQLLTRIEVNKAE